MKKFFAVLLMFVFCASLIGSMVSCGASKAIQVIDVRLTDESYAFAVAEGNAQLQASLNAYLKTIKENGTLDAIMKKYFDNVGTKVGVTAGEADASKDQFVVATNVPFSPFEYLGDDNLFYGIDIEIAKGYAESIGKELVIKNIINFDDIFTEITTGKADLGMAGITYSADRDKTLDFTDTYFNASQKLIVLESDTTFDNCKTLEDVENILKSWNKDKSVGYQNGTTGNLYVEGDIDWGFAGFPVTCKGYDTAVMAAQDLINGNLAAVVVDEAPAVYIVSAINGVNK
ncbi:MAG TPA: amino acid ABC transporter substrate-binding protein [Clostridiales bacterium]|nr:amino acid ABC transporter substrate-binding protein [Clostridiales bacterium]